MALIIFSLIPVLTRLLYSKQEPFDQGSMVRNFVKWDHQLEKSEDLREILQKAFHIATSELYEQIVNEPQDTIPALREALEQLRNGKPAVLDVWIK